MNCLGEYFILLIKCNYFIYSLDGNRCPLARIEIKTTELQFFIWYSSCGRGEIVIVVTCFN